MAVYAAVIIVAILIAAIGFRKRIERTAYGLLPENRKMLKAQKKRFEALKHGLKKDERDTIKQYLDQGCAYLAKVEMDETEKK